MHARRRQARIVFVVVELCMAFVFFWAVLHHVYTFNFRPLAAFCVPILVVFFAFSSLLYMRGRSLGKGKAQIRSLFAAERAMQAAIWYLFGILLGTSLYGVLVYFGVSFNPGQPTAMGLWLLLFIAPYALMQTGLIFFMRAVWVVTPHFLRPVTALEIRRRIDPQ